jgi:FkbM family methyltransferase
MPLPVDSEKPKKDPWCIPEASLGCILKSFLLRGFRLCLSVFRNSSGPYLFLTPAVLSHQRIYDRQNKGIIHAFIRDKVDEITLYQVYGVHNYRTSHFKRHAALEAYYEAIKAQGASPLILDCGGNIGLASQYFSYQYEAATIVCIEPDAANLAQARRNNTSNKVQYLQAALGAESGVGRLLDLGLGNNAYRVDHHARGSLPILSVEDLLQRYPLPSYHPFILKIDIEGSEAEVFSKNIDWIERFPLIIIELHDWMLPRSCNAQNFLKAIAPLNRDFTYSGESVFSFSNTLLG